MAHSRVEWLSRRVGRASGKILVIPAARALVLLVVAALSSGCGAHLYDAAKDTKAREAKTSYESAKLVEVITVERANLQKLLDLELGVVARHLETVLRAEWFRLIDSREPLQTSLMAKGIEKRLAQLSLFGADGKPDDGAIIAVATMRFIDHAPADDKAAIAFDTIRRRFKVAPPPCGEAGTLKALPASLVEAAGNRLVVMQTLFDEYVEGCRARTQVALPAIVKTGPIRESFDDWRKAVERVEELERAMADAKQAYERAIKEFDEAKAKDPQGPGLVPSDLKAYGEKIGKLLKEAEEKADALGIKFVSEEQIKKLDILVQAATGGDVDRAKLAEPDLKGAAVVVSVTPALAAGVQGLVADLRAPPVAALLLEKQRQEVRRDSASRRVERMMRRVDLRREKLEALALEVRLLQQARVAAANAIALGDADNPLGKRLQLALDVRDPGVKRQLYEALSFYIESIVSARRHEEQIDYRLIALDHEEAVDASDTAIGLWNALIATPINQLSAYHGSGFKSEQLAALIIQLVTLGSIGVGVNR